jgi:hypothetical protein
MAISSVQLKEGNCRCRAPPLRPFGEEAVEWRGDEVGYQGEAEEQDQQHQQDEQRPEDEFEEAQPVRQARHQPVDPVVELAHGKADQAEEQQQVDRQGQQHEQAQARSHHQFQAFAEVLRAAQAGHGVSPWESRLRP